MNKIFLFITAILLFTYIHSSAQVKILFDATKAQTVGNADWVIDADLHNIVYSGTTGLPYISTFTTKQSNPAILPTPAQSGITATTPETYWKGALSYWAIDCVKKGYYVETLPAITGKITYNNTSNAQDLSKYNIFVVDEPNIKFNPTERDAIINFVKNGGSLFIISDHANSDRNYDGWDSPMIWNDLFTNNTVKSNPFGIKIDSVDLSQTSSNVLNAATDSLLHGTAGNVTKVQWSNGATMTLDKTANPTVKGIAFKTGSSTSGSLNALCAYGRYGKGKFVAMTDSSPFDDGTGNDSSTLYNGYITDAAGNHQKLIMNATIWLATKTVSVPLEFISLTASANNKTTLLNWTVNQTGDDITEFDIQFSGNGETFSSCGKEAVLSNEGTVNYYFTDEKTASYFSTGMIYYRIAAIGKDGSVSYSKMVSIRPTKKTEISVYPNPTKNKLMIHVEPFTQHAVLSVVSADGRLVSQQTMNECSGSIILPVNNLTNGNYFIRLQKADGSTATTTFIKND